MANSSLSHTSNTDEDQDQSSIIPYDSLLASTILPSSSPQPISMLGPICNELDQNGPHLTNNGPVILNSSPPPSGLGEPIPDPTLGMEWAQPKFRGRPRGSKNKPKPPLYRLVTAEPALMTHVLEIVPGADIVEMVHKFSRDKNVGVSITSGVGRVKNVTVRSSRSNETTMRIAGTHDLLSITGLHVGPARQRPQPHQQGSSGIGSYSYFNGSQSSYIMVHLVGVKSGTWGGVVIGKLVAATVVLLNVQTFGIYEFHRLGFEDDPQPSSSGVGSSMGGSSSGLDPSSSASASADDMLNWDKNPSSGKRPYLSDF